MRLRKERRRDRQREASERNERWACLTPWVAKIGAIVRDEA